MEQLQNRILDLGKGWCFKFNITTSMCEIANELRGTELDCFYDDSKIGVFMKYLHSKWDD